jgi:hypothetical protein
MAIAVLKQKTIDDARDLAAKATNSVKAAMVVAGAALLVGIIALIVSIVK